MVASVTPAMNQRAITLMLLLALQSGMQPILTQKFTAERICLSTVVLIQEVLKFILALIMLLLDGSFRQAISDWTISSWVTVAFLPAALYALQNVAALQAYQYLDSMTFIVLNQTKTLSAALCCYLVMGRKQSLVQILSLFLLLLSALVMKSLVSLDSLLSGSAPLQVPDWHSAHWAKGVAPIMLASLLSGLSGALSQKDLQAKGGGRNAYLFSMELSIASICILGCSLVLSPDGKRIAEDGFWHEWTVFTWIPIFTSAMGGIIVGLVTKYVGSVRKGFALILGIFLSGVVQAVVQPEVGVSKDQAAGGILAAISLWMHASNPPISKEKRD